MTSEPMTPEQFAGIKARHQEVKRLHGEFWVDAGPTDADLDTVIAEVERLRCTDPIECGHEAALGQAQAEAEELRAELVEAKRDAHDARIDYNLARTRADKAEAQLSAVWALVEPWRSADFVSASLRDLVYGLLSIRDRAAAESSSPSEEQA